MRKAGEKTDAAVCGIVLTFGTYVSRKQFQEAQAAGVVLASLDDVLESLTIRANVRLDGP